MEPALVRYRRLRAEPPADVYLSEYETNMLGYRYYSEKKDLQTSLAILTQNSLDYPDSFNVYDSLGWLYDQVGQTRTVQDWYHLALQTYERVPVKNQRWKKAYADARKWLEKHR